MRLARLALAAIAVTLLSGHVAPAVQDNNRYLRLTPLGDRVRLAYTVFYGEVPGASMRPSLDTNHDGKVDDAEAHAFGAQLATQIATALAVEVDGTAVPVHWSEIDVGMGTPAVAAGAFSVDLVTYLCLARPRGAHHVRIRDRFVLARPGETEVKIEDSPGVTISRAHVGAANDPTYDFRFAGPGGPIADDGLDLAFVAGDDSVVADDGLCPAPPSPRRGGAVVVVACVVGALGLGAAWLVARRRRA